MTTDEVLAILGFALSVGGMVAALWIGRKSALMIVVAISVALITLLLMGTVVAKDWYLHREAIDQAQLEIIALLRERSMTAEDIINGVNARRPPGHTWSDTLLFDALYDLVDDGVLRVHITQWQERNSSVHDTRLYYR